MQDTMMLNQQIKYWRTRAEEAERLNVQLAQDADDSRELAAQTRKEFTRLWQWAQRVNRELAKREVAA